MSILGNLIQTARQYGPDAVRSLVRQGQVSGQDVQRAIQTVGSFLQTQGNPVGETLLRGTTDPDTIRRVLTGPRTQAALDQLNRQRQVRASVTAPPRAPRPQFTTTSPAQKFTEAREGRPNPPGRVFPEGSTTYQPNLPNPQGSGGRFQSIYGEPKSVIERRQRMAVPVPSPAQQAPGVSSGQIGIDSLAMQEPMGRYSRQLLETDPGTYQSVSDMALRASEYYKVPVTVEELAAPGGMDVLRALELRFSPGGALVRSAPGGALVRSTPGELVRTGENVMNAGADVAQEMQDLTQARNAVGGTVTLDLNKLKIPAAAIGGLTGSALLTNYLFGGSNAPTPVPSNYPLEPNVNLDLSAASSSPPPPGLSDLDPTPRSFVAPVTSSPGQIGSGSVVIRTNDRASNQRQANANAVAGAAVFQPQDFSNLKEYYRNRQQYSRQPDTQENLLEQFIQMSPRNQQADMQTWAKQNPGLMYELVRQNLPRDISQQPQNLQGAAIVTPLGSNSQNNEMGNTEEAVNASRGMPSDLRDATTPQLAVTLERTPLELQRFFTRPGFAGSMRGY